MIVAHARFFGGDRTVKMKNTADATRTVDRLAHAEIEAMTHIRR